MIIRLSGVTFVEGYPKSFLAVAGTCSETHPLPAELVRVPDNEFDGNAIAVMCVGMGGRIGWIPKPVAAILAPDMDRGGQLGRR